MVLNFLQKIPGLSRHSRSIFLHGLNFLLCVSGWGFEFTTLTASIFYFF